ncbi:MAG: hypothetical protein M3O06_03915 [Pseudomonadota bacterium]|nr:hypothetical protein [Pseudomonadota bacterium]
MKSASNWLHATVIVSILGAASTPGWATRAVGPTVSGEITGSPTATRIEVDHRIYHFKADSAAARDARRLFYGQKVDLVLSMSHAANGEFEVEMIQAHAEH